MKRTVEEYFSLKGRVAVVTGGGGELCGCMAEALGALGVPETPPASLPATNN